MTSETLMVRVLGLDPGDEIVTVPVWVPLSPAGLTLMLRVAGVVPEDGETAIQLALAVAVKVAFTGLLLSDTVCAVGLGSPDL